MANAVNVTVPPVTTVCADGCRLNAGGERATPGCTVSTASALVTEPAALVTTTLYRAPESATVNTSVYSHGLVAPAIAAPFLRHWYFSGRVPEALTMKSVVSPAVTAAL